MSQQRDVIVIGGGVAGLTAAVYLARAGRRVTVLEKASQIGGRAQTQQRDGFLFNLGPHALYAQGEGVQVLRELNIPFGGGKPAVSGVNFVVRNGRLFPSPADPLALLRSRLLGGREKLAFAAALLRMLRTHPADVAAVSLQTWVEQQTDWVKVRQMLLALGRVATYAHAPAQMSAAVFVQQMQRTIKGGVYYLHGGWQTLVDELRQAAKAAGARIETGVRVTGVREAADGVWLETAVGPRRRAEAIVVAADPHTAAHLLPQQKTVQAAAATAVPVRAAVLDVALRRLPRATHVFALGLDDPTYLSVHTAAAQLAPAGGAVIHLAKYLAPDDDGSTARVELEALLDLMQPDWRGVHVTSRFLPQMTVAHRLATAVDGGLSGRPDVALSDRLLLAGDWVGASGWLADASFASARAAAHHLLHRVPQAAVRVIH